MGVGQTVALGHGPDLACAIMTTRVYLGPGAAQEAMPADLLPCSIDYAGPAPASDYFRIRTGETCADGTQGLDAAFRGRRLRGQELVLPPGHAAFLLQQSHESTTEHAGMEADPPTRRWEAVATCQPLRYWNHDVMPTPTDAPRRCMEWLSLAESVSRHVSLDQVERKRASWA